MADLTEAIEACKEESKRLNVEKEKDYERGEQLKAQIRQLRLDRMKIEDAMNHCYTAATVDGLVEILKGAEEDSDEWKNCKVVLAAGKLCHKVTQLCEENPQFPLVDVPACLERAMEKSNFRGKEFNFWNNKDVTDAILRSIALFLSHVEVLLLSDTPVTDLNPLAGLLGLEELLLKDTQVRDLTPLAGLQRLRFLSLIGTPVTDITPLSELKGLEMLFLNGTAVTELTPLVGLTGLKELNLWLVNVADLTPLAKLTRLQKLNLTLTAVTDLAPLAGLTELQELDLNNLEVTDLTPLAGLRRLQVLNIGYTSVADVTPLSELPELQRLYLEGSVVSREDVTVKRLQGRGVTVKWD